MYSQLYGGLNDYDTRNNVFTMNIQNISNKNITILSKEAMVFDNDYKAYDRRVKLVNGKSSVTIKPRERKTIKFKVIGSITWYRLADFQLCSYWKWGNKTYWISVMPGDEIWKYSNNKWTWIGFAT